MCHTQGVSVVLFSGPLLCGNSCRKRTVTKGKLPSLTFSGQYNDTHRKCKRCTVFYHISMDWIGLDQNNIYPVKHSRPKVRKAQLNSSMINANVVAQWTSWATNTVRSHLARYAWDSLKGSLPTLGDLLNPKTIDTVYAKLYLRDFEAVREAITQKIFIAIHSNESSSPVRTACPGHVCSQICAQYIKSQCYTDDTWTFGSENCRMASTLLMILNTSPSQYGVDKDVASALNDMKWIIIGAVFLIFASLHIASYAGHHFITILASLIMAIPFFLVVVLSVHLNLAAGLFKHDIVVGVFFVMGIMPLMLVTLARLRNRVLPLPGIVPNNNGNAPQRGIAARSAGVLGYAVLLLMYVGSILHTRSSYLRDLNMSPHGVGFFIAPYMTQVDDITSPFVYKTVVDVCSHASWSDSINAERVQPALSEEQLNRMYSLMGVNFTDSLVLSKQTYWQGLFYSAAVHCHPASAEVVYLALRHMFMCNNLTDDLTLDYAKYLYNAREEIRRVLGEFETRVKEEGHDVAFVRRGITAIKTLLSQRESNDTAIWDLQKSITGNRFLSTTLLIVMLVACPCSAMSCS